MATSAKEYINQFDKGKINTDIGFLSTLRRLWGVTDENVIPGIVAEYDRKTHIAKVRPLIQKIFETSNEDGIEKVYVDRAELELPVMHSIHGGYEIDAPLFIGDTGFIVACDRSWATMKEDNCTVLKKDDDDQDNANNKGSAPPDDYSLSEYKNGFFIPCSWAESELENDDGLVIQRHADEGVITKVTINKDGIEIIMDSEVKILIDNDGVHIEDPKSTELQWLADIRYDSNSHQIQKKMCTCYKSGNVLFNPKIDETWVMMAGGQAEPIPKN